MLPVIIAGGIGSRLWPLSRHLYPKQFQPLVGQDSMLCQTLGRLQGLPDCGPPLVVCHREHRFQVAEQLRQAGIREAQILLEPESRNTAPAIAAAALHILEKSGDTSLLVLPADHVIRDVPALHQAIAAGCEWTTESRLVTFGILPESPAIGYGYIRRGESLARGAYAVDRFVEKPDREKAELYLADGKHYWNSGMFMFRASDYVAEMEQHAPEIMQPVRAAVTAMQLDLDFLRLGEEAWHECPSDSVDYAVMEKTNRCVVQPLSCGWNDAGTWSALWEAEGQDEDCNVLRGDVIARGVRNSYLRSESRLLTAVGVEDLIAVETADAVLIANRCGSGQELKSLVEEMTRQGRDEVEAHTRVYRPWGFYQTLVQGERFQVKLISVSPDARLSLQMHHHRAEHWVVVSGTATVTCDDREFKLETDQSTYIPLGSKHRLANDTDLPLELIEVQSGSYLGEDDIVRFEDVYGR